MLITEMCIGGQPGMGSCILVVWCGVENVIFTSDGCRLWNFFFAGVNVVLIVCVVGGLQLMHWGGLFLCGRLFDI
jgi:hypothetical protein